MMMMIMSSWLPPWSSCSFVYHRLMSVCWVSVDSSDDDVDDVDDDYCEMVRDDDDDGVDDMDNWMNSDQLLCWVAMVTMMTCGDVGVSDDRRRLMPVTLVRIVLRSLPHIDDDLHYPPLLHHLPVVVVVHHRHHHHPQSCHHLHYHHFHHFHHFHHCHVFVVDHDYCCCDLMALEVVAVVVVVVVVVKSVAVVDDSGVA